MKRCLHLGLCWVCAFCIVSTLQWFMAITGIPVVWQTILLTGVLVPVMILIVAPLAAECTERLLQAVCQTGRR